MRRLILALLILLPVLVQAQARRAVPFRDITIERGREYNVTHGKYGAIPDDGLTDVAFIQVAADSINSHGAGTLFFPPGQYEFEGDSVKIFSNTVISAYGAVFNDDVGSAPFFYMDGVTDVTFLGGEWDGNAVNSESYTEFDAGIAVANSSRIIVKDVYMHNLGGDGVELADVDYVYVVNSTIIATHVQDSPFIGRNCIALVEGDNAVFTDNILEGGDPACIDIEPNANLAVTNVLIANNVINGGQYAVSLNAGASGASLDSAKVVNNIISNTLEDGIRVNGATHWTVSGNIINSTGYEGIHIRPSVTYGKISGNDIFNSGQGGASGYAGILVNQSSSNIAILLNRVWESEASGIRIAGGSGTENKWITVEYNICWNNDRNSGGGDAGINISYTDSSVVENNNCFDDQGGSATQTYGFAFTNMDVNTIGLGNIGYGNKTRLNLWTSVTQEIFNQIITLSWIKDNPAASGTNLAMLAAGGNLNQVVMPWNGHITGMSATVLTPLDVGTITLLLVKNGSANGMNSVQLTTTDSTAYEVYRDYSDAGHTFVQGDIIGVVYTTSADYSPATLDYIVNVYIRH